MTAIPRQRSDTADLDHSRPCRIGWCDRSCRWALDPHGQVTRLHTRPVDDYCLSLQEDQHGTLDGPVIAFHALVSLTENDARTHVSTLNYLLSLVDRDRRQREHD